MRSVFLIAVFGCTIYGNNWPLHPTKPTMHIVVTQPTKCEYDLPGNKFWHSPYDALDIKKMMTELCVCPGEEKGVPIS